MTEIFKTNVKYNNDAERIVALLKSRYNELEINFDLEDCDSILRIENKNGNISVTSIKSTLHKEGFLCEILHD